MGHKGRCMVEHGRKSDVLQPRLSLLSPGPLVSTMLCQRIHPCDIAVKSMQDHSYMICGII